MDEVKTTPTLEELLVSWQESAKRSRELLEMSDIALQMLGMPTGPDHKTERRLRAEILENVVKQVQALQTSVTSPTCNENLTFTVDNPNGPPLSSKPMQCMLPPDHAGPHQIVTIDRNGKTRTDSTITWSRAPYIQKVT